VTHQFGGADFLGAGLVVLINVAGGQLISSVALPAPTQGAYGPTQVRWGIAIVLQVLIVIANWAVIAWRNGRFLNWQWSGVAAALIWILSLVVGTAAAFLLTDPR